MRTSTWTIRKAATLPMITVALLATLLTAGCSSDTSPSREGGTTTSQSTSTVHPDTLYDDAKMIAYCNMVHPGILEQFQNYKYTDGRTYHFYDAQGNPDSAVITNDREPYQQALTEIVPDACKNAYYGERGPVAGYPPSTTAAPPS